MRNTLIYAVGFAILWFLIKMVFFTLGNSELGFNVGVATNGFFLLTIVALILWRKYRRPDTQKDLISDVKDTSKVGLFYIILMSISLVSYYSFVDTDYLTNRKNKRIDHHLQQIKTDEDYAQLQVIDIRLENVTKTEYIEHIKEQADMIMGLKTIVFGGFLAYSISAFIICFLLSLLFRNFLFNNIANTALEEQ